MADNLAPFTFGAESPISRLVAVTPDDANDLPNGPARLIAVSVGGTLKITTYGGDTLTLPATIVADGALLPFAVKRIWTTGTTATVLVGW